MKDAELKFYGAGNTVINCSAPKGSCLSSPASHGHQSLTVGTSESDTLWTVTAAHRTSPSSSSAQSLKVCMVLGIELCCQHSCGIIILEDAQDRPTNPARRQNSNVLIAD